MSVASWRLASTSIQDKRLAGCIAPSLWTLAEISRCGAELLFQVLTEREEERSVAIASNESFGGWTKRFADPRLCAAIVDRLTFGGTIS